VAEPNRSRMSKNATTSSFTGFRKTTMSSAYSESRSLASLSLRGDSIPSAVACSRTQWRASIARMNKYGERESPCRSPLA
jgi:hypothetical protein